MPRRMWATISRSSIFVVLGFARLFLLQLAGYTASVSEYGVHWNFFFTIFFVKVRRTID